jgi:glycosyltransferase involved in cell wall biosynthesis
LSRHLWEQTTLPYIASQIRAHALVNLVNTSPLLFPQNIITVHDMAWLTESKSLSKLFSFAYSAIIPIGLRNALHVITVSEWSRAEILKHVHIADKLSVILEGVGPEFHRASQVAVQAKLDQLAIEQPYFLTVGTIQPRKNCRA